jgi:Transcriptional Coactivator p15 (PC4)
MARGLNSVPEVPELATFGTSGTDSGVGAVIVHQFEAGESSIRARVSRFRGRVYLDIREWLEPRSDGEIVPTKRGISVPADCLGDLQEAVDAFRAELERPAQHRGSLGLNPKKGAVCERRNAWGVVHELG